MRYIHRTMSMKRSKQSSGRRSGGSDDVQFSFIKPPDPDKTWSEHVEGKPDDAFAPYSLKTRYTKGALINHPKFGKGAVVRIEGSHVEVLFQDGPKKLGHGHA